MNKPLRLVTITRRFWPLVGGGERVMSNLSSQFSKMGHSVQLLTAQWESHWPVNFVHQDFKVLRIPNPSLRGWGTIRYMHALNRWLRENRDSYDAVLVSMLKHSAYAALSATEKLDIPVILRAEGAGETGDCQWHQRGRFGMRIQKKCKTAAAIIAPSQSIEQELLESGFDRNKVHYVPNGVELVDFRDYQRQQESRKTLHDAHPVLSIGRNQPLAIYLGRLHVNKGLEDLILAWRVVLKKFPKAKLWLVGEGPDGPKFWKLVKEFDLQNSIIFPGSFDEITDLLYAADVFVLPSYQEGMSLSVLEAMSAGTPIVASDIPGNRLLIDDGVHGKLTPIRKKNELGMAIQQTLETIRENPQEILPTSIQARGRVESEFSIQKMSDAHCEILQNAINEKK